MIDRILGNNCYPVLPVILVIDDSGNSLDKSPLDAKKTNSILQSALKIFGATVFAVENKRIEFLFAVVENLRKRATLQHQLLWFIFSGHGQKDRVFVYGRFMEFDKIIQAVTQIDASRFVFFFECCQLGGDRLIMANAETQHMVVYSAPPNEVSFHYDGVGLMATTLAEMLHEGYAKSLNDLQFELRRRLVDKIVEVHNISPEGEQAFKTKHLPVQISTMFESINLYERILEASKTLIIIRHTFYKTSIMLEWPLICPANVGDLHYLSPNHKIAEQQIN
jgi:hypothetical protein